MEKPRDIIKQAYQWRVNYPFCIERSADIPEVLQEILQAAQQSIFILSPDFYPYDQCAGILAARVEETGVPDIRIILGPAAFANWTKVAAQQNCGAAARLNKIRHRWLPPTDHGLNVVVVDQRDVMYWLDTRKPVHNEYKAVGVLFEYERAAHAHAALEALWNGDQPDRRGPGRPRTPDPRGGTSDPAPSRKLVFV